MCKNCFNGCLDPVSDKCVKYTGEDIPELGISSGDSLFFVEQQLTTYLKSVIIGTGVFPTLDENLICDIIQNNLPTCAECESISLNDILNALIASVCELSESLQSLQDTVNEIEQNYTPNCITTITGNEGTHAVLQAVINKVCTIATDVNNLQLELNNYVTISSINTYIQNYLDNITTNTVSSKMIPYVAVPYFGPLTYFDITGAGTGNWAKIYLCNGVNPGVPDLRGRTLVGATTMGNNPFNSVVDPGIPGNPTYSLNSTYGANQITLNATQMPSHSHSATATVSPNPHSHTVVTATSDVDGTSLSPGTGTKGTNTTSSVNLSVNVTTENAGGGLPHNNVQPSLGCYFIIYIP